MSAAGKAVAKLLAIEDDAARAAAAAQLAADLPSLLPDDPEMTAIVEEALAITFASTAQDKKPE